jgi:glycosyltransferase involved in cell wall biosynthesis
MEVVLDGAISSRLLGIPHILHYRGNTLDRPKSVFDFLTWFWTRTADRVFCISETTAEIFRKRGLGARVEVLYNPVAVAAFANAERSEETRRELGADPDDFLIGTVGRIHARKDLATFLRSGALVAQRFPNVRLAVIGAAEYPEELAHYEQLKALAHDLGIEGRLFWAGARRNMPTLLKALDLFVLCSRHEGFGRVAAEAMAAGTPMVVSREGALPELAEDGRHAFCATPGQPDDFARRIAMLYGDPGLRLQMSGLQIARAQTFSVIPIATRVAAAYRSLPQTAHDQRRWSW